MRERLEQIGRELGAPNDETVWIPQSTGTNLAVDGGNPNENTESTRRKIEMVLVIEDQEDQFLHLEAYLDELGIERSDYCEDFGEGVLMAKKDPYDLILMDVKGQGNPFAGLEGRGSDPGRQARCAYRPCHRR